MLFTNIYFVRHAHSTYTPDELGRPLSPKGFEDVEKVSRILGSENIDIVISSPYKRAIQTVEGIAKYIGREVILTRVSKRGSYPECLLMTSIRP